METLVFWAGGKQLLVTSKDRNLVFNGPKQFGFAKLLRNGVKNLDRVKVSAALGFVLKGHYWALAAADFGRFLPFAPIWVKPQYTNAWFGTRHWLWPIRNSCPGIDCVEANARFDADGYDENNQLLQPNHRTFAKKTFSFQQEGRLKDSLVLHATHSWLRRESRLQRCHSDPSLEARVGVKTQ